MQHQIQEQICQCNDGKYRLKSNCTEFNDEWYETEYLNEQTIIFNHERFWIDDCIYSEYLNKYLPEDEFYDSHYYCTGCDRYYHQNEESEHVYSGTSYCSECYYQNHTYCHNCQEPITNDESYYSEITNNDYCDNCYHDLHSYCENCGEDYWSDDGCDCGVSIHNYSYKPNPIFFNNSKEKSKYYIGVELETESKGNDRQKCAQEVCDISELFYLKNDSSIDDGFEIVTHPFSFEWFKEHKNIFKSLLETLRSNGYRSYNTTTCGIHIHISKKYLSGLDLAKLHLFFCQNEGFIKTISQRNPNNLDQWGKIKKDKKAIYDQSKKKGGSERYTAINLQNQHTIEFRIFRGTLNDYSYFKNIEFIAAICSYVKTTSLQQLTSETFYNYVKKDKNFKNLTKFMESKKCA
ncbi:MAG: amidoligase family protein [Ignavibacteriae bacterium]|nr:amidoligase family protein [Ignavibacteriota bacterium]